MRYVLALAILIAAAAALAQVPQSRYVAIPAEGTASVTFEGGFSVFRVSSDQELRVRSYHTYVTQMTGETISVRYPNPTVAESASTTTWYKAFPSGFIPWNLYEAPGDSVVIYNTAMGDSARVWVEAR